MNLFQRLILKLFYPDQLKVINRLQPFKFDLHEFDLVLSKMEASVRRDRVSSSIKSIESQLPLMNGYDQNGDLSKKIREYPVDTILVCCRNHYLFWEKYKAVLEESKEGCVQIDEGEFMSINLVCVYHALYACYVLNNLHQGESSVALGEIMMDNGYYKESMAMMNDECVLQYISDYTKKIGNDVDLNQMRNYPLDCISFALDRMQEFFTYFYRKRTGRTVVIPRDFFEYAWHQSNRILYMASFIYKELIGSKQT